MNHGGQITTIIEDHVQARGEHQGLLDTNQFFLSFAFP